MADYNALCKSGIRGLNTFIHVYFDVLAISYFGIFQQWNFEFNNGWKFAKM